MTLELPADEARRCLQWTWGTVEPVDDRSCEYRTGDDDLEWLALRLTMFRVDFTVHEPPELREELASMATRLARAAGRA